MINKQCVQLLSHRAGGTHQLQRGEVSLPPQVLLHVRAERSQEVVRIHHNVDEGVEQADEECCMMWYKARDVKIVRVAIKKYRVLGIKIYFCY